MHVCVRLRESERDWEKRSLLSSCLLLHYTPLLVTYGTDQYSASHLTFYFCGNSLWVNNCKQLTSALSGTNTFAWFESNRAVKGETVM